MSNTYAAAGLHGGHVMRIRLPSARDVLSGRGGDINSHDGNVQFREWVRERKGAYNLAGSKTEKVRIATEVIDLVKGRGGRFLQKDPKSGVGATSAGGMGGGCWWIEMDHDKAVSKTSQALREGAPQIRRAATVVQTDNSNNNKGERRRQQPKQTVVDRLVRPMTPTSMEMSQGTKPAVVTSPEASPHASPKPTAAVSSILPIALLVEGEDGDLKRPLPDVDDAYCTDRPEKRIRTEEPTPFTVASSGDATMLPVVPSLGGAAAGPRHHRRSNSLVNVERMLELFEMKDRIEFVNPFADDDEIGIDITSSERSFSLADGEDADTMISKYGSSSCFNGHDFYPGEEWFDGDDDASDPLVAGCAENCITATLVVDEVVSPEGLPTLSQPQVLMAC